MARTNTALKIVPHTAHQSASDWLIERLTTGKRNRFTEIKNITPALAEIMLAHNEENRPIRRHKVDQHIRNLQEKNFILTHQGIAFSKEGMLNDGQHRLKAIVESGISAPMTVTFGCAREEFEVIDQGGSRTSADIMHIKGRDNPKIRASISARVLSFEDKDNKHLTAQKITNYEATLNQDLMNEACECGVKARKISPPATVGLAYYHIRANTKQSGEKINQFWDSFVSGASLPASSPILKIRNLLVEGHDFGQKSGTQRAIKEAAAIILAWNAWAGGTRFTKGKWPHTTSLPEVE